MSSNMNENWKSIAKYEGLYEVSDMGRVRSLDREVLGGDGRIVKIRGRIMKSCLNGRGYLHVPLCTFGLQESKRVHRIVLETFVGKSDLVCNHKNGIKTDNRLCNLEWVTQSENVRYSYQTLNRKPTRGEDSSRATLTEDAVRTIRRRHGAGGVTQQDLADEFCVARTTIGLIIHRATWKHI